MPTQDEDKVWDLIDDIRVCMLTSNDGGMLRARPMHAMSEREAGAVWFFTDVDAHKDDELKADPRVCLAFATRGDNAYVSLSGDASVLDDRAKIKALWSGAAQAFFPGGPDDPRLRLLKVVPRKAEYWDGPSSSIVVAMKMAAARMTGDRPDMGENRKVSLG